VKNKYKNFFHDYYEKDSILVKSSNKLSRCMCSLLSFLNGIYP